MTSPRSVVFIMDLDRVIDSTLAEQSVASEETDDGGRSVITTAIETVTALVVVNEDWVWLRLDGGLLFNEHFEMV